MKKIHPQRKIKEIEIFEHHIKQPGKYFSFRRIPKLDKILGILLKLFFIENRGRKNALEINVKEITIPFDNLPAAFNGFTICFFSDLHLDGINELSELTLKVIKDLNYDIAVMGGDYRYLHKGSTVGAEKALRKLTSMLREKSEVYAVLGNHDEFAIAKSLTESGVHVLLNESMQVQKDDNFIYLAGIDDDYVFRSAEIDEAMEQIPEDAYSIMISHSPELYSEVGEKGVSLMLSGHTHGGQICLPGSIPILKEGGMPRKMIYGLWQYE